MFAVAKRVIAEGGQYGAIAHRAVVAAFHDALEFMLEAFQARNARAHLLQMLTGNAIRRFTGLFGMTAQFDQFADRVDAETEIAGVADEGKPLQSLLVVAALVAGRTLGRFDQSGILVVSDRRHLYAHASR